MRRVTLLATALLSLSIQVFGSPQAASPSFDSAQITQRISPSVVLIKGTANSGELLGTGFIISSDGKMAKNLHVVEPLKNGGVQLASGERFDSFSILVFDARKASEVSLDIPQETMEVRSARKTIEGPRKSGISY